MSVREPPPAVRPGFGLARLTTVRTGGPAQFFARAGSLPELQELLGWARHTHLKISVVGSGSNLLVADEGVTGLVLKLDRGLALIERDRDGLVCGGGARLPSVAARAAQAGLAGIEFGVNIPGTVGGAVRMNANAYGGQLARVLEWVQVASDAGLERRVPDQLGFAYRRSDLGHHEVVAGARFGLSAAEPDEVKAVLADMRARRRAAQPSGIKTFGSTFKNPTDPRSGGRSAGLLLSEAGCGGLSVGGARFSPKHANFIENLGTASTADVIAVMAEGRRRVQEHTGVALEPEVQTLGPVRFPWEGPGRTAESSQR